ncbi:hypothetical protein R5R35_009941 [Gryllus longicercus]|uniref:Regulatory protein zeste n=1 Tax=Gryllus longicercus TaxID=2509291 RepID=A0AAN9V6B1_9ORTH
MEKRTRSANFTIAEREILLEIVKENRNLIENKGTSDVSNREKNIGWSIVEEEFNASSIVTKRSAKCLRKCWENLKKAARKSVAAEKEEIFRTGGGLPKAAVRDTILEGVLSLISPSSRIENNYDCDAPGKPKGRENVTDDILKIEIPTDQAFSDWSCWNPKKLSQPASQPLQFATNGHISSTVSEASDDPLTEHLFVTQAVSTFSPCSTQAAVEGHPPTPYHASAPIQFYPHSILLKYYGTYNHLTIKKLSPLCKFDIVCLHGGEEDGQHHQQQQQQHHHHHHHHRVQKRCPEPYCKPGWT